MMRTVAEATVVALVLCCTAADCLHVSNSSLYHRDIVSGSDLRAYKQECQVETRGESVFTCLLRKLNYRNEVASFPKEILHVGVRARAWMYTLPILGPNIYILNERPDEYRFVIKPDEALLAEGNAYDFMYYRLDFNSFYDLLKSYNHKGREKSSCSDTIWRLIISPSVEVSGSSAKTMPFHDHMEVKLHGLDGLRNAFLFLFYHEAFMTAVREKRALGFRRHFDVLWTSRSRLYIERLKRRMSAVVRKFITPKFIYRGLRNYDFSWLNNGRGSYPKIPFFTLAKDDFYEILKGSNLLIHDDLQGSLSAGDDMGEGEGTIDLERIIENLTQYIICAQKVRVNPLEPFYIAEIGIGSSVYSFYDFMGQNQCNQLWQQPARYMISAKLRDPSHKGQTVALIQLFLTATVTAVIAIYSILLHLTQAKPWKV